MAMEVKDIEVCVAAVDAYRASGQSTGDWAQAHGVSANELRTWCRCSERWRTRLEAMPGALDLAGRAGHSRKARKPRKSPAGFVAVALPPSQASSVRVDLPAGACVVALHWPMSHIKELGQWLREVVQ